MLLWRATFGPVLRVWLAATVLCYALHKRVVGNDCTLLELVLLCRVSWCAATFMITERASVVTVDAQQLWHSRTLLALHSVVVYVL
jgi:hypothetical protein